MRTQADVSLRPLAPNDFEPLARLMLDVWGKGERGAGGTVAAEALLAAYLDDHSWGLVATIEGRLVGAILAGLSTMRTPGHESHAGGSVFPTLDSVMSRAAETDPSLPEAILAGAPVELREFRMTREIRASGAPESDATIQLLILSSEVRGVHLGSRLLDEARTWMRAQGARGYFLLTDDDCDFGFYDHEGLHRMRSEVVPRAGDGSPCGVYAYGELLS